MNTILSVLISYIVDYRDSSPYHILAFYILEHATDILHMSIQDLAQQCHVSTTTINRFCRAIGCSTYSIFRKELDKTLDMRKRQISRRYESFSETSVYDLLESLCLPFDAHALKEQIEHTVSRIIQSGSVIIYGASFPVLLSSEFAEDMATLGKPVFLYSPNYDLSDLPVAKHAASLALVLSFSGRWPEADSGSFFQIMDAHSDSVVISCKSLASSSSQIQLPCAKVEENENTVWLQILNLMFYYFYKRLKK